MAEGQAPDPAPDRGTQTGSSLISLSAFPAFCEPPCSPPATADLDMVAYEMTMLVAEAGGTFTPPVG